jgi:integrase/recombinase XerD
MLTRELRRSLREIASAARIGTRIVPHQFRHTYATEMLRVGVTLPSLMKLLGHSSADMTMRYLKITLPDVQREFHLARVATPTSRTTTEVGHGNRGRQPAGTS